MRRLRIALLSCLAVVVLGACDAGWVQPLGGPDHASFNAGENVLTLANVTTLQQAFHTSGVSGTPVVRDGVLVVAATGGNTVTAFGGTGGTQLWQQTLPGPIDGGPFIDGTQVRVSYVAGGHFEQRMDLFSGSEAGLDPLPTMGAMVGRRGDNSVRLNVETDAAFGPQGFVQISGKPLDGELAPYAGPLILGAKYLYEMYRIGQSYEGIAAYDPDQPCASDVCTPVWTSGQFYAGRGIPALTIGQDGTLYVPGDGEFTFGLTALDGNTGSVKWAGGSGTFGTPAVANGVVYSSSVGVSGGDIVFAAVSAADGHTLWTGNGAFLFENPTVAGGVVYGTNGNEVVAYNANGCGQPTCAPIWTGSLGTDTPNGALAVSGGVLYVGTNTGVTAFKPATS